MPRWYCRADGTLAPAFAVHADYSPPPPAGDASGTVPASVPIQRLARIGSVDWAGVANRKADSRSGSGSSGYATDSRGYGPGTRPMPVGGKRPRDCGGTLKRALQRGRKQYAVLPRWWSRQPVGVPLPAGPETFPPFVPPDPKYHLDCCPGGAELGRRTGEPRPGRVLERPISADSSRNSCVARPRRRWRHPPKQRPVQHR